MFKKIIGTYAVTLLFIVLFGKPVLALELTITDNGSGSTNEVSTSVQTATAVTQTNQASVVSDVNLSADSGGNKVSDTTNGNVETKTGDITANLTVDNTVNDSVVSSTACCQSEINKVAVTGNGTDSQNTIDTNIDLTKRIETLNTADVVNKVDGFANTGKNEVSETLGNVTITTGDIQANQNVVNGPINSTAIQATGVEGSDFSLKIAGNAADSQNLLTLTLNNNSYVNTLYSANILNDLVWILNTGENKVDKTVGDVAILTGNIVFGSEVQNGPVNVGGVILEGCCSNLPSDPGDPAIGGGDPLDPGLPSSGGTNSSSSGSGSSSGTAVEAAFVQGLSFTAGVVQKSYWYLMGYVFILFGSIILKRSGY